MGAWDEMDDVIGRPSIAENSEATAGVPIRLPWYVYAVALVNAAMGGVFAWLYVPMVLNTLIYWLYSGEIPNLHPIIEVPPLVFDAVFGLLSLALLASGLGILLSRRWGQGLTWVLCFLGPGIAWVIGAYADLVSKNFGGVRVNSHPPEDTANIALYALAVATVLSFARWRASRASAKATDSSPRAANPLPKQG